MLRQTDQKIKLFWRQMNVLATNDNAMLRHVDQEVAGCDDLCRLIAGCGAAAQLSTNAGLKFLHVERLGDVVVGTRIERVNLHLILVADRKNDDGNLRNSANLAAQTQYRSSVASRRL